VPPQPRARRSLPEWRRSSWAASVIAGRGEPSRAMPLRSTPATELKAPPNYDFSRRWQHEPVHSGSTAAERAIDVRGKLCVEGAVGILVARCGCAGQDRLGEDSGNDDLPPDCNATLLTPALGGAAENAASSEPSTLKRAR